MQPRDLQSTKKKRKIRLKKKKEKVTDEESEIKTRHTMAFP